MADTLGAVQSYVSRREPRAKQVEALAWLRGRRAAALLMSMRTGKTKVVADDAGRLIFEDQAADDLLVVAPGGVYQQWPAELRRDWPAWCVEEASFFTWVSARANDLAHQYEVEEFLAERGPRVLCVNAEALSAVSAARDLCTKFLSQRRGRGVLVVDESVILGNRDSELTRFVVGYDRGPRHYPGLCELAGWRRILSGLASPRSPLQLYPQFGLLGPEVLPEKFHEFRGRYCNIHHVCRLPQKMIERRFESVFGLRALAGVNDDELRRRAKVIWPADDPAGIPRGMLEYTVRESVHMLRRQELVEAIFRAGRWVEAAPVLDKDEPFRNLDELERRVRPWSFRVRLEDCYDVPESDYSFRDVELTPEQRRVYWELRQVGVSQLNAAGDHVSAASVVSLMVRLHQVLCGHTRDEDGQEHELPELRTRELLSLLADYDGKFVVWCSYDADVRKVSSALEAEVGPVARFWGGNVKTREMEERGFRENPAVRGIVATPDAGGRGRDWSVADLVVYYSNRNDLDKRAQSEERVKAAGKTRPVAYVDLRAPGTIEDAIIHALRKKLDLVSLIQADGWRRWLI